MGAGWPRVEPVGGRFDIAVGLDRDRERLAGRDRGRRVDDVDGVAKVVNDPDQAHALGSTRRERRECQEPHKPARDQSHSANTS